VRTVTIAARDAPQQFKDSADFVCVEDIPDHVTFAQALAALAEDGGRLVPYGTFDLTTGEEE
jgi:hypothetical protein